MYGYNFEHGFEFVIYPPPQYLIIGGYVVVVAGIMFETTEYYNTNDTIEA